MPLLKHTLGFPPPLRRRAAPTPPTNARISPQNQIQLPPTAEQSARRELIATGFNCVIDVLKITKEVSSACPQLQLAVGALLAVLEAYRKYSGATELVTRLLLRVETLNGALQKFLSAGYDDCPEALKRRLDNFIKRALKSITSDAKNLKSRGRLVRFVNASDDKEKVEAWVKTLSWHIQSFILEGTIALELTVYEVNVEMQNCFRELGDRVGEVHNEVIEMRDNIHQGTDSRIPGLRYAPHARFDFGRSGRSECDDHTRQEVLKAIYSWLRPENRSLQNLGELLPSIELVPESSILWIYALAGAGKTTLADTVANWCHEHDRLGSSFFCARDGDRSDVHCIVQNIASDIADRCPEFREALLAAVKDNPHIRTASVSQQVKVLLAGPVQAAHKGTSLQGLVVVVDALDECKDQSAESTFLQALSLYIKELAPLIFIITSRPVPNITRGFRFLKELRRRTQEFPLDMVPSDLTARDITAFVRRRFADIGRWYASAGPDWVSENEVQRVSELAEGLFIYAATVASFIEDPNIVDPRAQLDVFLRSVRCHSTKLTTGSTEARLEALDALYEQVLHTAFRNPSASLQARFKRVLGTIIVAEERLSLSGLSAILGEGIGFVLDVVERLRSVLSFSAEGDIRSMIRIIHLSFTDFLVNPERCKSPQFLVKPSIQQAFIALRCLKLMQGALRYNICEVPWGHTHLLNHEIPGLPDRIARHLPPSLQYACRYWLRHLSLADVGEELLAALESFCNTHLLHWLETLSLLGYVEIAVESLHSLQLFWKTLALREIRRAHVSALLYECERMSRAFYPAISASFMQVYRTAIPFSPVDSLLRRHYHADVLQTVEVRKGLEEIWSTTLMSRVIGTDTVSALAFSPDGAHVVYGAGDGSVRLLNAHTGAQLQRFEGHTTWIGHVAFSPTGMEVMTGSADGTVRVWDVAIGACLHTWSDHSGGVGSVAWSPNGLFLASGAYDRTTILREVASPGKRAVLGHRDLVSDITFAKDGSLVSGSLDRTCKIWDVTVQIDCNTANHLPSRTVEHSSSVMRVVVSPDSCLIACGLDNGEVVLWRKSDGQRLRSLPGESDVISIAFNSDSRLAAVYRYSPFILWDISTTTPLDTLDNARASVAVFSPDGVHSVHAVNNTISIRRWSGNAPLNPERPSLSMRLKRWFDPQVPLRRYVHTMEEVEPDSDPMTHLAAVSVSPTGTLVLTVYGDHWQLWDVSDGNWVRHKKCAMAGSVLSITAWSPTGDRFACTTVHNGVGVWETLTGNHLGTFSEHSRHVTAIAFTADEQHILTASRDGSIRRWTFWPTSSSEILFQSAEDTIDTLAVSPDGQWLLSGATRRDSPPDASSAELPAKPSRPTVQYWGDYCVLRLHDATGRVVWIENHPSWIRSAGTFSDDCMRILVGNSEGEVFLYDLTPLALINKAAPCVPPTLAIPEHKFSTGSTSPVFHVSFAPDEQGIITERSYIPLPSTLRPLSWSETEPPPCLLGTTIFPTASLRLCSPMEIPSWAWSRMAYARQPSGNHRHVSVLIDLSMSVGWPLSHPSAYRLWLF
ncbi:WD40 repeat-like protein [Trametes coccinea BRFM310]|uniref:WD40 repeat-like protein n=1 Tax=Trametes coccinea (strain BRFM310) TaxID=1353009 RepID=A0A1Y2IB55_TRAC3|nr:WD40 repeat-like protein [Trametes coccinea BRFM310]